MISIAVPPKPDKFHPIRKYSDFHLGFVTVSHDEWEDLCILLNVDSATINDLKSNRDVDKKDFCL